MAISEPLGATRRTRVRTRSRRRSLFGGGPFGNEQLTAITGVILLVLFAIIGVTILRIGQLLWLHLFVGMLLGGPVALKLSTTGYRFMRYYTHARAYRRKGPPSPLMRALGPVVILTTLAVLISGLLLLIDGPGAPGILRLAHKVSFFGWLVAMGLHVLGHLAELPRALRSVSAHEGRSRQLPGSRGRAYALLGSMLAGLVLALLFLPDVNTWTHAGVNYLYYHH